MKHRHVKFQLSLRVKLHVAWNCHLLLALVDLFNSLLQVSPDLLQVDVLQPRVAGEVRPRSHDLPCGSFAFRVLARILLSNRSFTH